jgi:hypothetical protein
MLAFYSINNFVGGANEANDNLMLWALQYNVYCFILQYFFGQIIKELFGNIFDKLVV